MPYADDDSVGRRWERSRSITGLQDPVRKAAETLADDVERYLYDEQFDFYLDAEFLALAVERYDHLKTGSGNYAQLIGDITEEHIQEARVKPFSGPTPAKPGAQVDTAVRLGPDAQEMLAKAGGKS